MSDSDTNNNNNMGVDERVAPSVLNIDTLQTGRDQQLRNQETLQTSRDQQVTNIDPQQRQQPKRRKLQVDTNVT